MLLLGFRRLEAKDLKRLRDRNPCGGNESTYFQADRLLLTLIPGEDCIVWSFQPGRATIHSVDKPDIVATGGAKQDGGLLLESAFGNVGLLGQYAVWKRRLLSLQQQHQSSSIWWWYNERTLARWFAQCEGPACCGTPLARE